MSNYSDSFFDESNHNSSWYKVYELIPNESRVLDIGCSSGNFGEVLVKRKRCLVDGIEPDKSDARKASLKLNKVWVMNIENDSLKNLPQGKYDFIYFGDVIEHLVNPIATLERVKPLLNKSGFVIFSIPNMGHIGVRLAILKGKFEYTETGLTDKTHYHFYTEDEVARVFAEAGYVVTNLDFVKKDYPKELIKKELKSMGLSGDINFYKAMSLPQASAFQFVGTAKPSKKVSKKLKQFGPIDLFERFHEDTNKNYELQINRLKDELEKTNRILQHKKDHPYRSAAGHIGRKIKR